MSYIFIIVFFKLIPLFCSFLFNFFSQGFAMRYWCEAFSLVISWSSFNLVKIYAELVEVSWFRQFLNFHLYLILYIVSRILYLVSRTSCPTSRISYLTSSIIQLFNYSIIRLKFTMQSTLLIACLTRPYVSFCRKFWHKKCLKNETKTKNDFIGGVLKKWHKKW